MTRKKNKKVISLSLLLIARQWDKKKSLKEKHLSNFV